LAFLAPNQNLAFLGSVQPVKDIHQGRLAGAIFAEQGVDGASLYPEIDPVVGDDSGETFCDALHLDEIISGHQGLISE
jgi:hypothetical protein